MNSAPAPQNSSELIDRLGGTTKTSDRFGVLPSAVSNWRKNGIPQSMEYRVFREAEGVGIELGPDSFKASDVEKAS